MDFTNNYAVSAYTLDGKYVKTWPSAAQAAKELGLKNASNIHSCISGSRNKSGGYMWDYTPIRVEILEGEEWKPVVGFEELYAVSNKGRVASIQYHGKPSFSIMSLSSMKGYPIVKIRNSKTGFAQSLHVHKLVAEAFIPNPNGKPCIDHIDTNTANNNVENLRWVTSLENQRNPLTLSRISSHMKKMNVEGVGPAVSAKNRSIKVKHLENGVETFYPNAQAAGIATGHTTSIILRWSRANRHGWSLV